MHNVVLVAHNLRSCHNVGSLLRTAEGLGVEQVILSGYTPYPRTQNDIRLPHEVRKIQKQIQKTALGAEDLINWRHEPNIFPVIDDLKAHDFAVYALEQTPDALSLPEFRPPDAIALVIGREVEGLEPEIVAACDSALEIPMSGQKESFNVTQAAAMALYHFMYC